MGGDAGRRALQTNTQRKVGARIGMIDGIPINGVAHWLGGNYVAECSDPVVVREEEQREALRVRAAGGRGQFLIDLGVHQGVYMWVRDAQGRVLVAGSMGSAPVAPFDLGAQATGLYTVTCLLADGVLASAKVVLE